MRRLRLRGSRFGASLLLLAFGIGVRGQSELPAVNTAGFLPSIRAQVEDAERTARAHPNDAQSVGAFAMTLHAYAQYEAAARVYSRVRLLEPGSFDWAYLLGAVQMELGDFEAAQASFRSALEISPSLPAELRLAQAELALGRSEEAAARYRRILAQNGESARAWYGLGRAQSAIGDHAGATQSYTNACKLFPDYGAAQFALAKELRRSGRAEEARRHMEAYTAHSLAEPPLDDLVLRRVAERNHGAQAHMQRAAELEKAGRLDEAIGEEEAALVADPVNVQAHINLIALYARAGRQEKAKEHFQAGARLNPGRSDLWYNYGVLLLRDRNGAEAEKAFRRALEINPDNAEAHDHLGVIHEQDGELDEAAQEFRLAVSSRPDYAVARFHLGRILANERKYDEAVQQFQRALETDSERTPAYLYALAATLARAGRREDALAQYRKAWRAAQARGQSQLVTSIERDMKSLGAEP